MRSGVFMRTAPGGPPGCNCRLLCRTATLSYWRQPRKTAGRERSPIPENRAYPYYRDAEFLRSWGAWSISPKACSKHCGKHWFSRPRLADCCAILSFRSLYALATTVSSRCRGRSSVNAAFDQQSPDDASHLVGQGNGDQHLRLAEQHLGQPRPGWRRAPTGLPDHRAGPEDQQAANGPLSAFRNGAELLLSARRFLQWRQPEPGGEIASGSEAPCRRHKGRDCGGSNRTHAWDRHQPSRGWVCLRAPVDLTIQFLDLRFQCSEGVDQQPEERPSTLRQRGIR